MAWFYEVRDTNNAVVETGKGFATLEAAIQLAEKVHFRRVLVAQALLPVLCFLPLRQPRTAKSGCVTDFFRKL